MTQKAVVTYETLVRSLGALGLEVGMGVMVHSSLSSFGFVAGGADTVIRALMAVLTPEGTLMMPSFNFGVPFKAGGAGVYDPTTTPTVNGAIPDAFWRMPNVRRSLDPTHPIAAWGLNAERFVKHHHRTLTMGPQSPLGLLYAAGGYGLLLGIDYTYNTFHHVVETTLDAPCLGKRTEAYPVLLPNGQRILGRTWGWREHPCPFTDENRYGALLAEHGLQRQVLIGACLVTLFKLQDCFQVLAELLQQGWGDLRPCQRCPIRPRTVEQTVSSDWDDVAQTLMPESIARGY